DDPSPDLLAIKQATGDLFYYRYDFLQFHHPYPKVGYGWSGYSLFPAGDVNNDGKNDLFGVSPDGKMYLYAGKGDGAFYHKKQIGNGWQGFDLISGADVDGDGINDLMSRDAQGLLYLYRGLGDGKFAKRVQVGNGWGPLDKGPDCGNNPPSRGSMIALDWYKPGFGIIIPF
ncbi:MAG: VCBS repeat-containing protein, partial [Micrococcales bacterium]|nr:VCBS repeat-containing protein [Micrococcales bacterium]